MHRSYVHFTAVILLNFALLACNNNSPSEKAPAKPAPAPAAATRQMQDFIFDKIDHYSYGEKPGQEEGPPYPPVTDREKELDKFLNSGYPYSINDSSGLQDLVKIGFIKRTVDSTKFRAFAAIFTPQPAIIDSGLGRDMCLPVYRNILVFSNKAKVNGIAKICFGCHKILARGFLLDSESFGQRHEYSRLGSLLYPKRKN